MGVRSLHFVLASTMPRAAAELPLKKDPTSCVRLGMGIAFLLLFTTAYDSVFARTRFSANVD
jgi:hypothetical protein